MAKEHEYIKKYETQDPDLAEFFRQREKEFSEHTAGASHKTSATMKGAAAVALGIALFWGVETKVEQYMEVRSTAREQAETEAELRQDQIVAAVNADGFTVGNPHTASGFHGSGYGNGNVLQLDSADQVQLKLRVGETCLLDMVKADYRTVDGNITDVTSYVHEPVSVSDGSISVVYTFDNAQELQDTYIANGEIC